jgi:hypothetical protein
MCTSFVKEVDYLQKQLEIQKKKGKQEYFLVTKDPEIPPRGDDHPASASAFFPSITISFDRLRDGTFIRLLSKRILLRQ